MTRKEELNLMLNSLQNEAAELRETRAKEWSGIIREIFAPMFKVAEEIGFELPPIVRNHHNPHVSIDGEYRDFTYARSYVYFDATYKSDIFSIFSLRVSNDGGVETNYYSTSASNDFELKREILIGENAKVVLANADSILLAFNELLLKYKDAFKALEDRISEVTSELNEIGKVEATARKEAAIEALKNGYEFTLKVGKISSSYPSIYINANRSIYNVKSIVYNENESALKVKAFTVTKVSIERDGSEHVHGEEIIRLAPVNYNKLVEQVEKDMMKKVA